MTIAKPKPKQLLRPITTGENSAMNQSQFLVITCKSLKAREKPRVHSAIGFASHWLKNWHESFTPITKRSNGSHVITFDSHLKTALNNSKTNRVLQQLVIYPMDSATHPSNIWVEVTLLLQISTYEVFKKILTRRGIYDGRCYRGPEYFYQGILIAASETIQEAGNVASC